MIKATILESEDFYRDQQETSRLRRIPHWRRPLVAIRQLLGSGSDAEVSTLCLVQGDFLVKLVEAYAFKDSLYAVSEHMPIALSEIIAAPVYPSEYHVVVIVCQVSNQCMKLKRSTNQDRSLVSSNSSNPNT